GAIAAAAQHSAVERGHSVPAHTHVESVLDQTLRTVDLDYILADLPQLIQESLASADRAATIVRSLATFAKRDSDRFSTIAIEDKLDSAFTLAWHGLKQRAKVVKDFGSVPPVVGNASELTQVFVHLLLNAADALESAAGTVTLHTGIHGDQVEVAISDTGR